MAKTRRDRYRDKYKTKVGVRPAVFVNGKVVLTDQPVEGESDEQYRARMDAVARGQSTYISPDDRPSVNDGTARVQLGGQDIYKMKKVEPIYNFDPIDVPGTPPPPPPTTPPPPPPPRVYKEPDPEPNMPRTRFKAREKDWNYKQMNKSGLYTQRKSPRSYGRLRRRGLRGLVRTLTQEKAKDDSPRKKYSLGGQKSIGQTIGQGVEEMYDYNLTGNPVLAPKQAKSYDHLIDPVLVGVNSAINTAIASQQPVSQPLRTVTRRPSRYISTLGATRRSNRQDYQDAVGVATGGEPNSEIIARGLAGASLIRANNQAAIADSAQENQFNTMQDRMTLSNDQQNAGRATNVDSMNMERQSNRLSNIAQATTDAAQGAIDLKASRQQRIADNKSLILTAIAENDTNTLTRIATELGYKDVNEFLKDFNDPNTTLK